MRYLYYRVIFNKEINCYFYLGTKKIMSLLKCNNCHSELKEVDKEYHCHKCGKRYRVHLTVGYWLALFFITDIVQLIVSVLIEKIGLADMISNTLIFVFILGGLIMIPINKLGIVQKLNLIKLIEIEK